MHCYSLKYLAWASITLLLSGCSFSADIPTPTPINEQGQQVLASKETIPGGYRFYPGDEISIISVRRKELSMTVTVDPYGKIMYPYVGEVQAQGLTASELSERLNEALIATAHYRDPQLVVGLTSSREQIVYILGEVNRPGPIPITGKINLLEALGRAGGKTYDAEMATVWFIRGSQSPPGVVKLDLDAMYDPKSDVPILNVPMIAGDVLYIPDSIIASVERFFVRLGHIIGPIVDLERGIALWPLVEDVLQGKDPRESTVIVRTPSL